MADQLKNLQAAARRRGLSLRKHKIDDDGSYAFGLYYGLADKRGLNGEFEDLAEVRDELRARPIED